MDSLLQEVLEGYRRFEDEVHPTGNERSSEQPGVLLDRTPGLAELEAISDLVEIGSGLA